MIVFWVSAVKPVSYLISFSLLFFQMMGDAGSCEWGILPLKSNDLLQNLRASDLVYCFNCSIPIILSASAGWPCDPEQWPSSVVSTH
jgi:hypothetical protein